MKVVHIKEGPQRDACLAKLCAEIYGRSAGLSPLVLFTGVNEVWFQVDSARLWALVGRGGEIQALALLVLDEHGEGVTLLHACSLTGASDGSDPKQRLITELATKAPLRVDANTVEGEAYYRQAGIRDWRDGEGGARIGLGPRHPAQKSQALAATLTLDETAILRRFKHDVLAFDAQKQRFIQSLDAFPVTL